MSGDPYLDPRTGVFRNRLGLTDRAALAAAEADLSLARVDQLKRRRLPGRYDLDHLRAFHWTIFQDVYPWAGQLRTVLIDRLRWESVDRDANIDAAQAAADGDLGPLRALLDPVVQRAHRRAPHR